VYIGDFLKAKFSKDDIVILYPEHHSREKVLIFLMVDDKKEIIIFCDPITNMIISFHETYIYDMIMTDKLTIMGE